jgi:DNA-damage-inducible protein J
MSASRLGQRKLLTRVAVEKALPFEVRVPNARTRGAMAELKKGKLQELTSVDALMEELSAKA